MPPGSCPYVGHSFEDCASAQAAAATITKIRQDSLILAAAYHTRRPATSQMWQAENMIRWGLFALTIPLAAVLLAAQDNPLPEGKGKDTLQRVCTSCHGLDQVTSQHFSKTYWATVVDDMVSRGADASDDDVNAIVSYLSRNFGKPVNINTATAKDIETGLAFPPAQAESVVKYRTDNGAFKSFEDLQKVPGLNAGLLDEQKKNITF